MRCNNEKLIIYQVFPRILTNTNDTCQPDGTLESNGAGKMNDYTPRMLRAIKELGVNTIWFTGIIENATKTEFDGIPADNPHIVKGEAGSPYAIRDYYDIAPAIATDTGKRMEEFEALVARCHAEGLKVLIDFVPNHTARAYHSDAAPEGVADFGSSDDIGMCFSPSNNYYYVTNQQFSPSIDLGQGPDAYVEFPAKATGNDCFNAFCSANDWYETVKLNYGHDYGNNTDHFSPVPDTWQKMLAILRFWASKGVDGFRCDMVFMVPLAFWHWVTERMKAEYPALIFIGEIYDIALYRPFLDYGGFDYLYDKVNLYDTLVGIDTMNYSTARLTGCWQTVDGIGARMVNFLENHDEVRYASDAYAGNPLSVIPSLVVSSMISTGPFILYYGQELGEKGEENEGFAGHNHRTTIFDYWSYSCMRRWYDAGRCTLENLTPQEKWLRSMYARILRICNEHEAIRCGGFFDLMYVNLQNPEFDPHRLFAFLRHSDDEVMLIVVNFGYEARRLSLNIPDEAFQATGLAEGIVESVELLTDRHIELNIRRGKPLNLHVDGRGAILLTIRRDAKKSEMDQKECSGHCASHKK